MNEQAKTETITLACRIGGSARTDYEYHYSLEQEVPIGLTETQQQLMQRGFKITLQNKFSVYEKTQVLPNGKTHKVKASHEEKNTFTLAKVQELKDGTYAWKDGDSDAAAPLTTNVDAWLMYYKMRGTKISKRAVSRKTLHTAQLGECIAALINKDPALKDADNLTEQGEALLEVWIAEQESDPTSVGGFIALQESMKAKVMA